MRLYIPLDWHVCPHKKVFFWAKAVNLAPGVSNGLNTWDTDVGQPVRSGVALAGNEESFKSVD